MERRGFSPTPLVYRNGMSANPPQPPSGLLEQYKSYISDVTGVGTRHTQANTWYVSLLSALLVIIGLTNKQGALGDIGPLARAAVALLGILLCLAWHMHVRSYGLLYKAKFEVLREMEKALAFPVYQRELERLTASRYFFFTRIEMIMTLLLAAPFVLILAVTLKQWPS